MKFLNIGPHNIDIVQLGQHENESIIQFIFCPYLVILGHVKKERRNFDFRGHVFSEDDFGTDFYEIKDDEADFLVSVCDAFTFEEYATGKDGHKIKFETGSFQKLMEHADRNIEFGIKKINS